MVLWHPLLSTGVFSLFGSKKLCSPTGLDLHLGNATEGKQINPEAFDALCEPKTNGTATLQQSLFAMQLSWLFFPSLVKEPRQAEEAAPVRKGCVLGDFVELVRKSTPQRKDVC